MVLNHQKKTLYCWKNNFKHFIELLKILETVKCLKLKIGTFDIVTMMWTLCNSFS